MTSREKTRYRLISEELFAGGQRRLQELQEMIKFRNKMGRKFSDAVSLVARVPKNIGGFTVSLAKSFAHVMMMVFAIRGALELLRFAVPAAYDGLKAVFTPYIPDFVKTYAVSAQNLFERVTNNFKKRFDTSGVAKSVAGRLVETLAAEFRATMEGVGAELYSFYRKYEAVITYTVEILAWSALGAGVGSWFGGVGAVPGAAIGAIAGAVIAFFELGAREKARQARFDEMEKLQEHAGKMAAQMAGEVENINAEILKLKSRAVQGIAAIKEKRRRMEELLAEKENLLKKQRHYEFSKGVQSGFFYGSGGRKPGVVQMLEALGYKENVDYRLEVSGEDEEKRVYLRDFMGTPVDPDGDNVGVMERLRMEVLDQYSRIMQGSQLQNNAKLFMDFLDNPSLFGENTLERRLVFDENGNLRREMEALSRFYSANMDWKVKDAMDNLDKEIADIYDFNPLSREEREELQAEENRLQKMIGALQEGKATLGWIRDTAKIFSAALAFYSDNVPGETLAAIARPLHAAYREAVSSLSGAERVEVEPTGDSPMVNIIYKNGIGEIPDVDGETLEPEIGKKCQNINSLSLRIVSNMQGGGSAPEPEETAQAEQAEPSINVLAAPYSMLVFNDSRKVLYNTEAMENHGAFDQSGHMESRNADKNDLVVINF